MAGPLRETEMLRRLVGLVSRGTDGTRGPDPAAARLAYRLLDLGEGTPESFLTHAVLRVLRHLDHDTEQRPVVCRGELQGRISWPATLRVQYGQDYDPGRYVCRQVRRRYDTPENQLLKFLVERLAGELAAFPAALRDGWCYLLPAGGGAPEARRTAARLDLMEAAVRAVRRSVPLRGVAVPARIVESHLARAGASRAPEYQEAVLAYERLRQTSDVAAVSRRVLPLPGRDDSAGEPWLRLAAGLVAGRAPALEEEAA